MAGRRLPNPAFLLSAALLVLAAGASARPPFSPESDADATNAASALPRDPLPSPAAAQQRRSLQATPLPNFEIGVPAPPKRRFKEWQSSAVRERPQEFGSATFLVKDHPPLDYVALCLVARDAHADLLEWVNHHLRLGVGKVYVWDHASQPPMEGVVKGYIGAGLVEYHHFSQFSHPSGKPQLYAYDECLQRYGGRHTWLGFIDVDEFLMFRDPWPTVQSLPNFLAGFEGPDPLPNAYSGVGVHWLIFGSSGHTSRPSGGVLRSYHRCIRLRHAQHALVKTIVRTACTTSAEGPHSFRHNCSLPVVQTDKTAMQGARSEEPVHKRLALHHYATKSRDEFALKMVRGSAMKRQRGWEYFAFIDDWSTEFNFDGPMLWDTLATFQHYPAITKEHLQRYTHEQHENFWLKGADDPRYQEQLRQQQAAAAAAAQQAAGTDAQKRQQDAAAAAAAAAEQKQQQDAAAAAAAVAQQQDAAAVAAASAAQLQQDAAAMAAAAAAAQQQDAVAVAAAAAAQQQQDAAAAAAAAAATQQQAAAGVAVQR